MSDKIEYSKSGIAGGSVKKVGLSLGGNSIGSSNHTIVNYQKESPKKIDYVNIYENFDFDDIDITREEIALNEGEVEYENPDGLKTHSIEKSGNKIVNNNELQSNENKVEPFQSKNSSYAEQFKSINFENGKVITIDKNEMPNVPDGATSVQILPDGKVVYYNQYGIMRVVDKDGNIEAEYSRDENDVSKSYITYRDRKEILENGRVIRTDYNDGGRDQYIYDENGFLLRIDSYDSKGEIVGQAVYEYDSRGIKTITVTNREEITVTKHDDQNMPLTTTKTTLDGKLISITHYENGNPSYEIDSDGKVITIYNYSTNGLLLSIDDYSHSI